MENYFNNFYFDIMKIILQYFKFSISYTVKLIVDYNKLNNN